MGVIVEESDFGLKVDDQSGVQRIVSIAEEVGASLENCWRAKEDNRFSCMNRLI